MTDAPVRHLILLLWLYSPYFLFFSTACGHHRGTEPARGTSVPSISQEKETVRRDGQKWALLIGINEYLHNDDPERNHINLRGAVNDIENMADVLVKKFGFPMDHIKMLKNNEATRSAILETFQKHLIDNAKANDVVVFHYSGHGTQLEDRSGDEIDILDEAIVPHDSRDPEGKVFDIPDDELRHLFETLSKKCRNVTAILDCCHSGSITREGSTLRKIRPDRRPRPRPIKTRRQRGSSGDQNYALITACRADEVAGEFDTGGFDEPFKTFGVLSYSLAHALRHSDPEDTYQDIIHQVRGMVKIAGEPQNPQLEGNHGNRVIFGMRDRAAEPFISADPVPKSSMKMLLYAGRLHGLTRGSRFLAFPPKTKSFTDKTNALGEIEIAEVNTYTAVGKVLGDKPLPANTRVVELMHRYPERRLHVYVEAEVPGQIVKELQKFPIVKTVPAGRANHLRVSTSPDGDDLLIWVKGAATGGPRRISLTGSNPTPKALELILSWARWFHVLSIENMTSSLKIEMETGIVKDRADIDKGFRHISEADHQASPGDFILCRIRNRGDKPVFLSILNLSTDGKVTELYPATYAVQSLPSGEQWQFGFVANLPEGESSGKDILKVFASERPVRLSFLEQSPTLTTRTATAGGGGHPLERLLRRETRGVARVEGGDNPNGWVTRDTVVLIQRSEKD